MRAKLTYKVKRWSEGSQAEPLPALRDKHGEAVAELAEMVRMMVRERQDQPKAQDVKHTLQSIADDPNAAVLDRLDSHTDCALLYAASHLYGETDLAVLAPEALARCADQARQGFTGAAGAPSTDDLAVMLIRSLLALSPRSMRAAARNELIADALFACGLHGGVKNVERLLRKARHVR